LLTNCEAAVSSEPSSPEPLNLDTMTTWESTRGNFRELLNEAYDPEFNVPPNNWEKEVEDVVRIDDYFWAHLIARDIGSKGIDPDGAQRADFVAAGLLGEENQVTRDKGIEAVMRIWYDVNVDRGGRSTIQDDESWDPPIEVSFTSPVTTTRTRVPDELLLEQAIQAPSSDNANTPSLGITKPITEDVGNQPALDLGALGCGEVPRGERSYAREAIHTMSQPASAVEEDSSSKIRLIANTRRRLEELAHWRVDPALINFSTGATEFDGSRAIVSRALLGFSSDGVRDQAMELSGLNIVTVKKMKGPSGNGSTRREAEFLVQLSHEYIIKLQEFVEDMSRKMIWLVLPWEENGNLKDFIASQEWEIPEQIYLINDVARGVEYLHSRQPPIRHGDLKSSNILVNSKCWAVITDFGSVVHPVTKGLNTDMDGATKEPRAGAPIEATFRSSANTITVTENPYPLRLTAPEVLSKDEFLTASDIWALGWLASEVLTNSIPFEDWDDSTIIQRVLQLDPTSSDSQVSMVLELSSHVAQCWSIDPSRRPTAQEFREAIGRMPQMVPNAKRTVDAAGFVEHFAQALLLMTLGDMYQRESDYSATVTDYSAILGLYTDIADSKERADALPQLAQIHTLQHQENQAPMSHTGALEMRTYIYSRRGRADVLKGIAELYRLGNDYGQAISFYLECLQIHTDAGDIRGRADALIGLADVHRFRSEYSEAVTFYSECLQIRTNIGDRRGRADALKGLADVHLLRSEYDQAVTLYSECLQIRTDIGDRRGRAKALMSLAGAIHHYEEATQTFKQIEDSNEERYLSVTPSSVQFPPSQRSLSSQNPKADQIVWRYFKKVVLSVANARIINPDSQDSQDTPAPGLPINDFDEGGGTPTGSISVATPGPSSNAAGESTAGDSKLATKGKQTKPKVDKWFNLETPDLDTFKPILEIFKQISTKFPIAPVEFAVDPPPLIIQVLLSIPQPSYDKVLVLNHGDNRTRIEPTPRYILLESWRVEMTGRTPKSHGTASSTSSPPFSTSSNSLFYDVELPTVYKQSIAHFRSVYTLLRVLPAWKLYRRLQEKQTGLGSGMTLELRVDVPSESASSSAAPSVVDLPLVVKKTRIIGFDDPLSQHPRANNVESRVFSSILSPLGELNLSLKYRVETNFALESPESLLSADPAPPDIQTDPSAPIELFHLAPNPVPNYSELPYPSISTAAPPLEQKEAGQPRRARPPTGEELDLLKDFHSRTISMRDETAPPGPVPLPGTGASRAPLQSMAEMFSRDDLPFAAPSTSAGGSGETTLGRARQRTMSNLSSTSSGSGEGTSPTGAVFTSSPRSRVPTLPSPRPPSRQQESVQLTPPIAVGPAPLRTASKATLDVIARFKSSTLSRSPSSSGVGRINSPIRGRGRSSSLHPGGVSRQPIAGQSPRSPIPTAMRPPATGTAVNSPNSNPYGSPSSAGQSDLPSERLSGSSLERAGMTTAGSRRLSGDAAQLQDPTNADVPISLTQYLSRFPHWYQDSASITGSASLGTVAESVAGSTGSSSAGGGTSSSLASFLSGGSLESAGMTGAGFRRLGGYAAQLQEPANAGVPMPRKRYSSSFGHRYQNSTSTPSSAAAETAAGVVYWSAGSDSAAGRTSSGLADVAGDGEPQRLDTLYSAGSTDDDDIQAFLQAIDTRPQLQGGTQPTSGLSGSPASHPRVEYLPLTQATEGDGPAGEPPTLSLLNTSTQQQDTALPFIHEDVVKMSVRDVEDRVSAVSARFDEMTVAFTRFQSTLPEEFRTGGRSASVSAVSESKNESPTGSVKRVASGERTEGGESRSDSGPGLGEESLP
ncbi:hypothetical protein FS837_000690, partial [Tulasnella sp. UAMH 9824]